VYGLQYRSGWSCQPRIFSFVSCSHEEENYTKLRNVAVPIISNEIHSAINLSSVTPYARSCEHNVSLKNAVFWDVLTLCRFCVYRRFGGTYHLHLQVRKIREPVTSLSMWQLPAHACSSLADFSNLKIEAICSSETSVHTRSTQRHIPEEGILHSHRCENLKSYIRSPRMLFRNVRWASDVGRL
jgi:hypothetical protein